MDHFFTGAFIRRRVRFMAKSQLFKGALPIYIFSHGGVFPVRRGHHDEEAFQTAFKVLTTATRSSCTAKEAGREPGRSPTRPSRGSGGSRSSPGSPVVPLAILGSQQVRNWKRLRVPEGASIQYGEPFKFPLIADPTREQQQAVADYILERIRELHTSLATLGYRGSMRELKRKRRAKPSPPAPPAAAQAPRSPTHAS